MIHPQLFGSSPHPLMHTTMLVPMLRASPTSTTITFLTAFISVLLSINSEFQQARGALRRFAPMLTGSVGNQ
jgi:hypothetical protein